MIAVILKYESRQNPAYRSTLARAFLRDFRSHLFAISPHSLNYVSSLVLYGMPQFKLFGEQSCLAIGMLCQSVKLVLRRCVRCLHYFRLMPHSA